MSNEKYVAPEMDIIEFGNEDVCTASNVNVDSWNGQGGNSGIGETIDTWDGSDFES